MILHLSDPEVFLRNLRRLGAHFLVRDHALLTIVSSRFLPRRPWLSNECEGRGPPMFRSPTLGDRDIDNLYSELMSLPYFYDGRDVF